MTDGERSGRYIRRPHPAAPLDGSRPPYRWVALALCFVGFMVAYMPRLHAATAIGAASVVMMLCAMVGIPLFGHSDATGSWTWSWIYLTSVSAVSTVAACFVREERKRLQG